MDEIEGVADGAAEPVEGVHDGDVAVAGVGQGGAQAGPVGGGAGLLVEVDVCGIDADALEAANADEPPSSDHEPYLPLDTGARLGTIPFGFWGRVA